MRHWRIDNHNIDLDEIKKIGKMDMQRGINCFTIYFFDGSKYEYFDRNIGEAQRARSDLVIAKRIHTPWAVLSNERALTLPLGTLLRYDGQITHPQGSETRLTTFNGIRKKGVGYFCGYNAPYNKLFFVGTSGCESYTGIENCIGLVYRGTKAEHTKDVDDD